MLLQLQAWSASPLSPNECRIGITAALKKLTPQCDANRHKFAELTATAQQLSTLLTRSK